MEAADPRREKTEGMVGLIFLSPRGDVWSGLESESVSRCPCFSCERERVTRDQTKYLIHQRHQFVRARMVEPATAPGTLQWRSPGVRGSRYLLHQRGLRFLPQYLVGALGVVCATCCSRYCKVTILRVTSVTKKFNHRMKNNLASGDDSLLCCCECPRQCASCLPMACEATAV